LVRFIAENAQSSGERAGCVVEEAN